MATLFPPCSFARVVSPGWHGHVPQHAANTTVPATFLLSVPTGPFRPNAANTQRMHRLPTTIYGTLRVQNEKWQHGYTTTHAVQDTQSSLLLSSCPSNVPTRATALDTHRLHPRTLLTKLMQAQASALTINPNSSRSAS